MKIPGRLITLFTGLVSLLIATTLPASAAVAEREVELTVVGGPMAPFIQAQEKSATGFVPDLIREALSRALLKAQIEIYPWERAFKMVSNSPAILHMSLSRTRHREKEFTWIYPLFRAEAAFVTLTLKKSFPDVDKKTTRICVLSQTPMLGYLRQNGYRRIIESPDNYSCARLLKRGRVDVIFSGWFTTLHAFKTESLDSKYLRRGKTLMFVDVYLAASPQMDAEIIERLRTAVRSVIGDGTFNSYLARYNLQGLTLPKPGKLQ